MGQRLNWIDDGLCVDASETDKERFFSEDMVEQSLVAAEYCYECPVRDLCLQSALDHKTHWGVWGGANQEHLRDALGLDENGRTDRARSAFTLCPKCRMDDYTVTGATRLGVEVSCNDCGLSWETRAKV